MTHSASLKFPATRLGPDLQALRLQVREFLNKELPPAGSYDTQGEDTWDIQREFAEKVAARGWIGMTWPKKYGGGERSFLERFVVNEEMQARRAPVAAYFVADRQSGPTIIKYGSDYVKNLVLPKIVKGELCFCIGMSEPNSGSDLFAASAKATVANGGWLLNGTKIWTTNAHHADYMIGLFRTAQPLPENRRFGLTSFLVDMHAVGVNCRPIRQMNGQADFNEVNLQNVFVPDTHVIGLLNEAWKQATTELAYERSGPERFLESYPALVELVKMLAVSERRDRKSIETVGRLVAELHALRRMSLAVAGLLEEGKEPIVEASMVKDLGTIWEQRLPDLARRTIDLLAVDITSRKAFQRVVNYYIQTAPKLTIQGGTTEILRGIIARGLKLR